VSSARAAERAKANGTPRCRPGRQVHDARRGKENWRGRGLWPREEPIFFRGRRMRARPRRGVGNQGMPVRRSAYPWRNGDGSGKSDTGGDLPHSPWPQAAGRLRADRFPRRRKGAPFGGGGWWRKERPTPAGGGLLAARRFKGVRGGPRPRHARPRGAWKAPRSPPARDAKGSMRA